MLDGEATNMVDLVQSDFTEAAISPLAGIVANRINQQIQNGTLPSGCALPTERQLSIDYGVSRPVIRSAIKKLERNGVLICRPKCRPVVREVKRHTDVAATRASRHLAVWIWPNTAFYPSASMIAGIQAVIGDQTRLMIGSAGTQDWETVVESERRFLLSLCEDPHCAGAILWYLGGEDNLPSLEVVRSAGIPLVFVDRLPPEGFEADFVGTNNLLAASRCMRHLMELGHKRIGVITNRDKASAVAEREAGLLRAMQELHIAVDEDLFYQDRDDEETGVAKALDKFLSLPEPPTAIFGINDHIALQAYDVLTARGFSLPEDMSIVGFDGILQWVPGGGYITTAHQDFQTIGQTAAEMVLRRIEGCGPSAFRHVILDAPLCVHGSTCPPRQVSRS